MIKLNKNILKAMQKSLQQSKSWEKGRKISKQRNILKMQALITQLMVEVWKCLELSSILLWSSLECAKIKLQIKKVLKVQLNRKKELKEKEFYHQKDKNSKHVSRGIYKKSLLMTNLLSFLHQVWILILQLNLKALWM